LKAQQNACEEELQLYC